MSQNTTHRHVPRGAAAMLGAWLLVACATATLSASTTPPRIASPVAPPTWRVATLEHVDLWLHGFAMLTSDTGHVPFFARGYKQQIIAAKHDKGIVTQLDANRQTLSARFATNPALANAQFLAMYFSSLQEIATATDYFIRSSGNPRAARDPQIAQEIAMLAANFPQPADRNWLRLFVQSLQDEDTRFYHAYWTTAQASRAPVIAAVNEQWASRFYPKLTRFLNNTQQAGGQLLLSIPLGAEGRTVNDSKTQNIIAVGFPATPEAAPEAVFVFVHEAVATLVGEAITDNTTPAEQRSGAANEYAGNGAVRSGLVLLQRVAPDQGADYMRFYLRVLGKPVPDGDPTAAFTAAFPIPQAILAATTKQIDLVLGGI
jgi:hypothetical protein